MMAAFAGLSVVQHSLSRPLSTGHPGKFEFSVWVTVMMMGRTCQHTCTLPRSSSTHRGVRGLPASSGLLVELALFGGAGCGSGILGIG